MHEVWEVRNAYRILFGDPFGKKVHVGDLRVDGRVIFQFVVKE
jgi:hypothetical protein